jgi:hypothetical protein
MAAVPDPEPIAYPPMPELPPAPDPFKVEALRNAARLYGGREYANSNDTVRAAKAFEAYLRGE